MPPIKRRGSGCWTCLLRHRKCDKKVPECHECKSRRLDCHGYGPEPHWMLDPETRQEELTRVKKIVNANFRHLRRLQNRRNSHDESPAPATEDTRLDIQDHSNSAGSISTFTKHTSFREASLLMHYLDCIFWLQFPYHLLCSPDTTSRGWLLWLLNKDGPLRPAALTLSALHADSQAQTGSSSWKPILLQYHAKAMEELQRFLSQQQVNDIDTNSETWLEFLACGVAMISFEVFQGEGESWNLHLAALMSVVAQLSPGWCCVGTPQPITVQTEFADAMKPAWRFLITLLLWFDLTACVSTGTAPRLPYSSWLGYVDMTSVYGCENWAAIAIGDAAQIQAQAHDLDEETLRIRIRNIEVRILDQLAQLHDDPTSTNTTSEMLTRPCSLKSQQRAYDAITKVFATSTLVQLDIIQSSNSHSIPSVEHNVERVIEAIRQLPADVTIRGLTWPLCVVGCVAQPAQRGFFEDILQGILGRPGSQFGNCGIVLSILRHAWAKRELQPQVLWDATRSMADMGVSAFLV